MVVVTHILAIGEYTIPSKIVSKSLRLQEQTRKAHSPTSFTSVTSIEVRVAQKLAKKPPAMSQVAVYDFESIQKESIDERAVTHPLSVP